MTYAFAGTYGPQPITDAVGRPLASLSVSIFAAGTSNLVTLYTDRTMGTTAPNPTMTDSVGNLTFFCAPGRVTIAGNQASIAVEIPPDPADVVPIPGATMTGPLVLAADPTVPLGAATKQYVDSHGSGRSGVLGRTSTSTLAAGETTVFSGSLAAQTLTLPGSVGNGFVNTIINLASVSVTIAPGAGTTINNLGTTGNITLAPNTAVTLTYNPTVWTVESFSSAATVGSVAATDASIVIGGTATAPTIQRAALTGDVITTLNAASLVGTVNAQSVIRAGAWQDVPRRPSSSAANVQEGLNGAALRDVVIGDSIPYGQGIAGTSIGVTDWQTILSNLETRGVGYPDNNRGFARCYSFGYSSDTWDNLAAGAVAAGVGPSAGVSSWQLSATNQTIGFTRTFRRAIFYFSKQTNGAGVQVSVNGGSTFSSSVDTNGSGYVTYDTGDLGFAASRVVQVKQVAAVTGTGAAGVLVHGAEPFQNAGTNGLMFNNLCAGGTTAQAWASTYTEWYTQWLPLIKPRRVYVVVGVNDFLAGRTLNQISTDLSTICTRIQTGSPLSEIVLCAEWHVGNHGGSGLGAYNTGITFANWGTFTNMVAAVAQAYGCTFIDMSARFGDAAIWTIPGVTTSNAGASATNANAISCTTNGTTTLTTAGNFFNSLIVAGMAITGTNIPANTTVASVQSATSLTLSQAATGSGTNSMTFSGYPDVVAGMTVTGTGIPSFPPVTVASIAGATVNFAGNTAGITAGTNTLTFTFDSLGNSAHDGIHYGDAANSTSGRDAQGGIAEMFYEKLSFDRNVPQPGVLKSGTAADGKIVQALASGGAGWTSVGGYLNSGDANPAWFIGNNPANGLDGVWMGPGGASGVDTYLYRSSAGVITTNATLVVAASSSATAAAQYQQLPLATVLTASSGTFTPTVTGAYQIICVGGGGSGGGGGNGVAAQTGGGGGGQGECKQQIQTLTANTGYSYTIGAGGATANGGAGGSNHPGTAGNNGSPTTFTGPSTLVAQGGGGGAASAAASTTAVSGGGYGLLGTTGNITIAGIPGTGGIANFAAAGGAGGAAIGWGAGAGGGGGPGFSTTNGGTGGTAGAFTAAGGGAGGAFGGSGTAAGGNGTAAAANTGGGGGGGGGAVTTATSGGNGGAGGSGFIVVIGPLL